MRWNEVWECVKRAAICPTRAHQGAIARYLPCALPSTLASHGSHLGHVLPQARLLSPCWYSSNELRPLLSQTHPFWSSCMPPGHRLAKAKTTMLDIFDQRSTNPGGKAWSQGSNGPRAPLLTSSHPFQFLLGFYFPRVEHMGWTHRGSECPLLGFSTSRSCLRSTVTLRQDTLSVRSLINKICSTSEFGRYAFESTSECCLDLIVNLRGSGQILFFQYDERLQESYIFKQFQGRITFLARAFVCLAIPHPWAMGNITILLVGLCSMCF